MTASPIGSKRCRRAVPARSHVQWQPAVGAHVVEQYTDDVLETGRARGRQPVEALAIRVTTRRTDGRVAFVAVAVGYFLAYSLAVGQLGPGRGTFGVSVVDDPLLRMRSRMAPYRYEPIATISLGPVDYLFSPIDATIALGLAALVGCNLAVSIVAWRSPSTCGLTGGSAGVLAGVPAMLSGVACCGPIVLIAIGVQATAGLLAVFRWLLPATALLLVATLLFVGSRVDSAVLEDP